MFDSWWTYNDKNSTVFERAVVMMHGSSSWMLGEEEGLSASGDLIGRSSGRWSDGCSRAVRNGYSGNLRSDDREFLCKRNSKEEGNGCDSGL
jgi:hypothetical protein